MIRPATIDDVPNLVELGAVMHQESRFRTLAYSPGKAFELLVQLIANDDGCVLVVEKGGQIIGGFAGMVVAHWFSPDRVASDFALFIHPEHRGGMAAARLLKGFIAWARSRGAVLISAGITTGVHVEASTKLYEHLGFTEAGAVFNLGESDVHRV